MSAAGAAKLAAVRFQPEAKYAFSSSMRARSGRSLGMRVSHTHRYCFIANTLADSVKLNTL